MTKKKNLWKFSLRLLGLLIITMFLIFDLIITIDYPDDFIIAQVSKATERLGIYYAYFTTQTNYLVVIYLFSFLFESRFRPHSKPSFYMLLSITVYITITMLVFWTGIATNSHILSKYGTHFYPWFKTIVLHFIMPIIMIINFVFACGKEFYSLKEHHKLYLWFICFYPAFYLIIVMVRGVLRSQQGELNATRYPYFFLNYQVNGVGILVCAIVGIFVITISLQYFYLWINNITYKKKKQAYDSKIEKSYASIVQYPYGTKL